MGSTMYKVPNTAKNLGYCEKGCPPVSISNKMPVTTGDARLQRVATVRDMPAQTQHVLICMGRSHFSFQYGCYNHSEQK